MRLSAILFVACCFLQGCNTPQKQEVQSAPSVLDYVDPFIGTGGHVHTFPGATVPFGMVQLSPDGDTKGWDWCSGYHQSDNSLMGFSHTHLSGTGWSDLGDILVMPTTGEVKMEPGSKENPDEGFRSRFSHDNEEASAGYYRVFLKDYAIDAELTTTERVGIHRYTFPKSDAAHVIFDPTHKIFGKTLLSSVSVGKDVVRGYSHSTGWGGERTTYFTAKFSKPFSAAGVYKDGQKLEGQTEAEAGDAKAWVSFETKEGEQIEVKVAISGVSQEGADKNLEVEASGKDFDTVLAEAKAKWEEKLSRIQVTGGTEDQKTIFYTGLYHNFIAPNLWMDVDGKYWALDQKLQADGFANYSTFSLWDTFRATHPLLSIIDQKTTADFANSLIARYHDGNGTMPVWELTGYDNVCMIGYHSVSMINDALAKGVKGIDPEKALEAMIDASLTCKESSSDGACGLNEYIELGYVPSSVDKSVSKTLEYAYNDWCIASLAQKLGKEDIAEKYFKRSENYRNLFQKDKHRFWMKGENGTWHDDVEMNKWDNLLPHYISGNFWAYDYFVPHNVEDLVALKGGTEAFEKDMDAMLANNTPMVGDQHVDISGFIGKFGHGDEPGHHIPYLYNYTDSPWKSQRLINEIRNTMYANAVDGMVNNEDCGQMSAWYIFSSLGFYPLCPGESYYNIGTPLWNEAKIQLEDGNVFTVKANNVSPENIYVKSVTINGKPIDDLKLLHKDVMAGGELVFEMTNEHP